MINAFSTETVDEDSLYDAIIERLKLKFPSLNPEKEIRYLLQWIYNIAENKSKYTLQDLYDQLISFREFESVQLCASTQLGIRVNRLFVDNSIDTNEVNNLREDFNKGISVSPKHITAGIDLKRSKWLEQIEKAFQSNNIVIVHGASGQGKSALCYKYAFDNYSFVFEIRNLTSNLLPEIIATVKQIPYGLKVPVLIYLDINPGESDWQKLVKKFSDEKMIHLLVSVREEDWNHNSARINHLTQFAEVPLSLTIEEAKQIYSKLCPSGSMKEFFDIWEKLGEAAPLLEFAYYINHHQSLRSRLESQYQGMSKEQRKLLAQIIIPNYLGSSVSVSALAEMEGYDPIENPLDLKNLENEYFFRIDDRLLDLHPVRTSILKDIITQDDFSIFQNIGCSWINLLSINNRDRYLINLLREGVTPKKITQSIQNKSSIDGSLLLDIIMALLWQGCKDYVDKNHSNIDELQTKIGLVYQWFIPINFTKIDALDSIHTIFQDREDLFNECCDLMNQMDNQSSVFIHIKHWLDDNHIKLAAVTSTEYKTFGKALYLLSLANLTTVITLPEVKLANVAECDCKTLAYLLLGLKSTNYLQSQWSKLEGYFIEKARQEFNIYNLSISGTNIDARIFLNLCKSFDSYELKEKHRVKNSSQFIHSKVLSVCEFFRMAFPDKLSYNSSIECGDLTGEMIDTKKSISHNNLPVRLMYYPRKFVCGICSQKFRTNSKLSYFEETINNRQIIIRCCSCLSQFLKDRLSDKNATNSFSRYIESLGYLSTTSAVELPIGMFDPLSQDENIRNNENIEQIYKTVKTYSSEYEKYYNNLSSFLRSWSDLFNSEDGNYNRLKFLLFQSLQNIQELKEQTLILGNSYLQSEKLNNLCNREEKVLKKLLQQCTFHCKSQRKIYHDSFIKNLISENPEKIIKRCVDRIEKIFSEFGLCGNVQIEHNIMRITLIYGVFDVFPNLDRLIKTILLSSFMPSDWLSTEQYLLEKVIKNVEFIPLYEDKNGQKINISGILYNVATIDLMTLAESSNWELHLKKEKDKSEHYPKELQCVDSLKSVPITMLLMGSQTEQIAKEINSDNREGQSMLNQLYKSYRETVSSFRDILDECKNVLTSELLGEWDHTFESIYGILHDQWVDDRWLKSTKTARDIMDKLNENDYYIKKDLVIKLGYEIDI